MSIEHPRQRPPAAVSEEPPGPSSRVETVPPPDRDPFPRRLLGRDTERSVLDRLISEVVGGASRVLVLRGEAGIGKSSLLHQFVGSLRGWRVAAAVGAEAEIGLAYSGLHQVCVPLLEHLDQLPSPQRDALSAVLGLSYGPAPDPFLVGLATLTLVAKAAERQPVACVIDDAQWLDHASSQVLAFVARRLLSERVALVCAVRTGVDPDVLVGLPELPLQGLADDEARTLLSGTACAAMDHAVIEQGVRESRGNPLALLELPRVWQATNLPGCSGLTGSDPGSDTAQRNVVQQVSRLPADAALLTLAAAAEPLGDRALLSRAAVELGLHLDVADPAVEEGLLTIGEERVTFVSPLARATVYRRAAADDRRRVHRALAEVTDPQLEPDRRAWHRACAAVGPDQEVAEQLERSVALAQARGGFPAAAAFLTRATELTPDDDRRGRRALEAAFANLQAGGGETAKRLLILAPSVPTDDLQQARIELLAARLLLQSGQAGPAATTLLTVARRLETLDVDLARETYLDAFTAASLDRHREGGAALADVALAARAAPRSPVRARTVDFMLDAVTALVAHYDVAAPLCLDVLQQLCADNGRQDQELRWLWHGTALAIELWDDQSACCLSQRFAESARRTGALGQLALALQARTAVLSLCGDIFAASSVVSEGESVERSTGIRAGHSSRAVLAAWRGLEREAKLAIRTSVAEAGTHGEGLGLAIAGYAHAVLCNGLGQYEEALEAATRATEEPGGVFPRSWALSELVEAAARTGHADLAADAQHRLAGKARASATEWALGMEARSRAILSEGSTAEDLYREAIAHLSQTRVRSELCRAHLLYGEWLRRSSRRVDARTQLNVAYESFSGLGMNAFAERARRELLATGATARKRNVQTTEDLTPQEVQIASLARRGLSNPEIGSQLFLSARTVEWHLHKVFRKLSISSRRELADASAGLSLG